MVVIPCFVRNTNGEKKNDYATEMIRIWNTNYNKNENRSDNDNKIRTKTSTKQEDEQQQRSTCFIVVIPCIVA